MAEALISGAIENLCLVFGNELSLTKGIAGELKKLQKTLVAIQSVLRDAEQRQVYDESVKRWLSKLEEVSYDVDGVLDEWCTAIRRSQIEDQDGKIGLFSKKVCFPIPSPCLSGLKFNRLSMRRDIGRKIIELNKKLSEIACEKEKSSFERRAIEEERRMTTFSTPVVDDESETYGRKEEKDTLLGKLLSVGPQIIPIVGMGGLGKTTLAKLVYNDDAVQKHFDKRIWVQSGYPFDLKKAVSAIIESITGSGPEFLGLESVLTCFKKSIQGKRFLLVLDDVWLDDLTKWESLEGALNHGAVGSKVIVTTRKEKVAAMMGATPHMIVPRTLSDEDCWLLFSGLAFQERSKEECKQLEGIGRKIASKCHGLPLVARTLGNLMRFKHSKQEWLDVLHKKLWEMDDDVSHSVFAPLLLSYYDLRPLERLCFSYCAIFPEDHVIDREDLIELWMSQGYLDGNKKFEIGEKCFESLAMRSFFQDFENKFHGKSTTGKMHDVIRDFAQFVMRNNSFIWEVFCDEEKTNQENETTRHFTLLLRSGGQIPFSVFDRKKLRTLFLIRSETSTPLNLNLLPKLKSLRTLRLSECGIEALPSEIGKLSHLRYLNLSYNSKLRGLPYGLCKLFNLQTLNLEGCTALQRLPEQMGKLVNLQHLYINDCNHLEKLPIGIGRLAFLTKLDTFIVPCNYFDNEAMKLGDLSKLKDFRGRLCIHGIGDVEDAVDARKVELKKRKYLADLKLNFSQRTGQRRTEAELTSLLEALQPHSNLISLEIREYHGATFPNWLTSLINLRRIAVNGFPNCEILPPFGKLHSLEILHIADMGKVEKVGLEFLGLETCSDEMEIEDVSTISFPRLKELRFQCLSSWKYWSGIEDSISSLIIMPSLRLLEISNCRSLETLPDYIQTKSVQNLTIDKCPILEKRCQERRLFPGSESLPFQISELMQQY